MVTALQVIVSIILIVLVLIQERSGGLSGAFGGGGAPFETRRGLEKRMYQATIVTAVAFFVLAVVNLII
ncbi:MAG: preprotein translocase subunit SecG [Nanoarchaeota archaeon]|nr:preprotein translocase subunit SecG [Nanoarchaeota archaeon]